MDDQGPVWHLTVRRYGRASSREEIAHRRAEGGVAAVLRADPGFRAYRAAWADGGGGVFSVTVLEDRAAMLAANARVLAWAGEPA